MLTPDRTFSFSSKYRWVIVAALESAADIIRTKEQCADPAWMDDPDVGALTVTLAVATRLHLVERAEA